MRDAVLPVWHRMFLQSRRNRMRFKLAIGVYDILVYALLVWSVHDGRSRAAVLGELLASQLPLLAARFFVEYKLCTMRERLGYTLRTFNPREQSWAFLGDFLGLAPMLYVAALAWPALSAGTFWDSWWWAVLPLVPAVGLSWLFRKGEGKGYDVLRYMSLTKLLHNGAAFLVLSAIIIHTMIPLLFAGTWSGSNYPAWALGFFLVWLVGVIGDGIRGGVLKPGHPLYLDPRNLHPQADEHGHYLPDLDGVPSWYAFRNDHPGDAFNWIDVLQGRRIVSALGRILSRRKARTVHPDPDQSGPTTDVGLSGLFAEHRPADEPRRPG